MARHIFHVVIVKKSAIPRSLVTLKEYNNNKIVSLKYQ